MKKLFSLLMVVMLSACTSSIHMSQVDVGTNSQQELASGKVINIEKSQKIFKRINRDAKEVIIYLIK